MPRSLPAHLRARGVTAVLGPTNTGKTHLAIERLVAHSSGMIGLPLRLLAREVYNRVVARVGPEAVALVTGEEKIKPDRPRYWIATVEAMPRDLDTAFVAIDEIQLAADLDRGHVFTDRLLNQRGREETLIIGSGTMRPLVEQLIPGVNVVTRPRLSNLSFAGDKKISRLPPRSAIVAFSAEEVYAIAELIRRYRGGAAVVLGALSPRTRNAQVALFEAGDVDYLIATDAIGMGLNLDVGHVAFAARTKYDGFQFRDLHAAELGQIAGRAGRHLRDGTFGSTGRCQPFDPDSIDAVENHRFDPVKIAQWRNPDLDTRSMQALLQSLAEVPREPGLTRAPIADDEATLAVLAREGDVARMATGRAAVERLWEVCGLPDYRRISPMGHADLVGGIYGYLMKPPGRVPADWFARHLAMVDRTEGDIDTLSQRLAHVRTWSFVANRPDWLADPEHWQGVTRRIEDSLSDALHERLAQRFVDRRTSVLMRRLRENATMEAQITASGDVTVEGQHVGHLHGFHFVPDPAADGTEAKAALRNAAAKALAGEIESRAERIAMAPDSSLVLSNDGILRWTGDPVARLEPGDKTYEPGLRILADEQLTGPARDKVDARLKAWLKAYIVRLLGPALEIETAADVTGLARGIAFQLSENLGVLERSRVAQDLRSLDQPGRAALRAKGVRFGAYHVYMPALIKPAPRILAAQLWALRNGGLDQKGIDDIAHLAGSGRTSFAVDPEIAKGLYRAAGFRAFATRALRVDILERLADLIRPAIAYRPGVTPGEPPPGAADGDAFVQTGAMTSLVGTSGEDFGAVLRSLGYTAEARPGPAITVPLLATPPKSPPPGTLPVVSEGAEAGPAAPTDETGDAADEPAPGIQDDAEGADSLGPLVDSALEAAADEILAEAEAAGRNEAEDGAEPEGQVVEVGALTAADEPAPDIQEEPDAPVAAAPGEAEIGDAAPDEDGTELAATPDEAAAETGDAALSPPLEGAAVMVSDGPAAADAELAAPATIEVWRLQRHQREQHPRGRQNRRNEGRGGPRPDGDRRPEGGQRPDRRDQR
ncbi:helicase-related protein, partial [Enterovirga sp.]|uniref:helicase-related protein n=1 Tax=Enterovirga sp. TaxID=2026350 RepID=UPI00261516EA